MLLQLDRRLQHDSLPVNEQRLQLELEGEGEPRWLVEDVPVVDEEEQTVERHREIRCLL